MVRVAAAIVLVGVAVAAPACTRLDEGVPVADGSPGALQPSPTTERAAPSVPPRATAPAGAPCVPADLPPVRVVAQIADPAAPKATVGVPDGWSMAAGNGDPEGARLEGPDLMEAVVTITPTSLDAEAAFGDWTDFLTEGASVSTVSVLPGDLCGYRGQVLMGNLADDRQSVDYRDRLVYVGTAAQNYLIVVHAEAPSGTAGFDEAAALVTGDFEIGLS